MKQTPIFLLTATFVAALGFAAGAQDMALPEPVGMDGNPAARMVLAGNAAFLHGDFHAAENDYHAALKRIPDFAVAAFNLGLVEAHEGQRARGLAQMNRGIDLAERHGMTAGFVERLRSLRRAFAATPVAT